MSAGGPNGAALADVAERLASARRVCVLTGAGVSAASGVPTFRGAGGLWRDRRPEELATPEAFAAEPSLVWAFYEWRRERIRTCRPNRAHEVLAAWGGRLPRFTLVTQNVDGLHERAGSAGVLGLHGSLWEVRCAGSCPERPFVRRDAFPRLPPPCPGCGGPLRPGVVWFGEPLDEGVLAAAAEAAASSDVYLVVGTSSLVHPAAGLTTLARRAGAFTVEINPDVTVASDAVDRVLRGRAEQVLDAIDRAPALRRSGPVAPHAGTVPHVSGGPADSDGRAGRIGPTGWPT